MQIERDLIEDTRVAFQRLRIAENKRNELDFFDWESSLNLESFFVCLRWMRKKAMRCLRCRIILISISISFHFKAAFAYLTEFEAIFAPWNWWESSLVSYDFDLRLWFSFCSLQQNLCLASNINSNCCSFSTWTRQKLQTNNREDETWKKKSLRKTLLAFQ